MYNKNFVGAYIKNKALVNPVAQAAAGSFSLTSSPIDTRDGDSCLVSVFTGALTGGGSCVVQAKLQESDTSGGSYTDVVASDSQPAVAIANITAASSAAHLNVNCRTGKAFKRLALDVALVTATAVGLCATASFEANQGPANA